MKDVLFRQGRLPNSIAIVGLMCRRVSDDLCATIEPLANPDVQTLAARMLPSHCGKSGGFLGRRREGKTRRPPGTLTDAKGAGTVEGVQNAGDVAAGEARAALRRGKMIAKAKLQFLDRSAEARKVVLGKGRQRLHQDQAANVGALRVHHWRKSREGRYFVWSVYAAKFWVEDSKDAPTIWKRQMADDRRWPWFISVAAIDD
jgi:hypothetical protein